MSDSIRPSAANDPSVWISTRTTGRATSVAVVFAAGAANSKAKIPAIGTRRLRAGIFGRRAGTGNHFGIGTILAGTSDGLEVMNVDGPHNRPPKKLDHGVGKCR